MFVGQTAALWDLENPTFRIATPSPSSGWWHLTLLNYRCLYSHTWCSGSSLQSYLIALMMDMEFVSETLNFINPLISLSARETFIGFCRRGNFMIQINNFFILDFLPDTVNFLNIILKTEHFAVQNRSEIFRHQNLGRDPGFENSCSTFLVSQAMLRHK